MAAQLTLDVTLCCGSPIGYTGTKGWRGVYPYTLPSNDEVRVNYSSRVQGDQDFFSFICFVPAGVTVSDVIKPQPFVGSGPGGREGGDSCR